MPQGLRRSRLSGGAGDILPAGATTRMKQTPFERYGGFATVSRIVMSLYDRLLEDDEVGPFFDDVDMPKLIDHQTKFVSSLMGGPASFTDEHIAALGGMAEAVVSYEPYCQRLMKAGAHNELEALSKTCEGRCLQRVIA